MAELFPPSVSASPSIADQIKKLEAAAAKLNLASDELSKPVTALNAVLKQMNVGVPAWHRYEGEYDDETMGFWKSEIGYAKVKGEWGIAVRSVSGFADDPGAEKEESWLFDDAPRKMRIEAIDHLAALLTALVTEADTTADQLQAKVQSAKQIADAATAAVTQRFDRPRHRK
jgi:hypothetical protein